MPLTRAQLENHGDLWANIANTVLRGDSPAFPYTPYAHRHPGAMDNCRVEVLADHQGRASDFMQYANIGGTLQHYYAHHQVRLAFTVVGSRADSANVANYAYAFGRIGYLMSKDAQRFTNTNVQNLAVLDIEDEGAPPPDPDEKTDRDRSTRNFLITYVVPPAVMAAAT
jgi:hypothetical protein